MKLTITPEARQWFKQEFQLISGNGIRFYGKVYGKTNVHDGFSIGLAAESPEDPLWSQELDGITYFIEKTDDWFFAGYDLVVDYDAVLDEPNYTFKKSEDK